jgi:predicted Zn-dependent protease
MSKEKTLKALTVIVCQALTILTLGQSAYAKPIVTRGSALTQDTRTFHHSEAGVQFELPKGWKAKPDGEVITVSTEDDSLQMVFWVPDDETLDAAVKALDKEIEKTVKNMKTIGKPTEDTHNGMPHFSENGTGEVNGTTIEWSVDVLAAKKVVIILTFAAPELREKHANEAAKFISSIKKMP